MLEYCESIGDCREHMLAKEKKLIPVTEAIVKSCAKPSDLNRKNLGPKEGKKGNQYSVALKTKIAQAQNHHL